MEETALALRA